ncbi:MAG: ribonuclease III domain-containing protein [Candidatus Thorarchaeota archaeon]
MYAIEKGKLRKFQDFIGYEFNRVELLEQALTTPSLGKEMGKAHYEFLETLGDAVIKIIFILKLYRKGITNPGKITQVKASLESDKTLRSIANKIELEKYIFKKEKQKIKGTRILADIFEAICGALFLDSNYNLNLVEQKIIDPLYEDLDMMIQKSIISTKNELLEYLQDIFKTSIKIELEYRKFETIDHDPIWIAENPTVIGKQNQKILITIPKNLKSGEFKNKKDAEKDIYAKILKYLEKNEKHEI